MSPDVHGLALTLGESVPSARYRVRQHIEPLRTRGIHIVERWSMVDVTARPETLLTRLGTVGRSVEAMRDLVTRVPDVAASRGVDVTWVTKWILPGLDVLERFIRSPLVLDIDDAIWCRSRRAGHVVARLASEADHVIAGNDYLASRLSRYSANVSVVPTAVDTDRYSIGDSPSGQQPVIGWMGTRRNLSYLYGIEESLCRAIGDTGARLLVVADAPPEFRSIPADAVEFRRWSPATEARDLGAIDVGLMPLADGEWERGKCGFKALQYMASGKPFVASPVGVNAELVSTGAGRAARDGTAWTDHLIDLLRDPDGAARIGEIGRAVAERDYSVRTIADRLAPVLRSAGERR